MNLPRALANSVLVRLFCSVILLVLSEQLFALGCTGNYNYTNNGDNTNYDLNSGQSLKISSGTYTGTINNFPSNTSICVESGATFSPSNLNNSAGTITNYGTVKFQTFSFNSGVVLDNYGLWNFTSGLNFNGSITIRNRANATMSMANGFTLANGSSLENHGFILAKQDFNTNSGTTLTNNYRIEMEGNFNPDGEVSNYGRIYSKKFMNANSAVAIRNYCTFVSYDGFNNNGLFYNSGTILVTTPTGGVGGLWRNNQNFVNELTGKIAGGDFTNNANFSGAGALIFSGTTSSQNSFAGTSSQNPINFYDETQSSGSVFDSFSGTVANTTRLPFARPTELDAPESCASPYKSLVSVSICPGDASVQNQSAGNVTSAIGGSVDNLSQVMGTLQNETTTATSSNSAKINPNGALTLNLGKVVPADSPIVLSLAPVDSTARVKIEVSLDGIVFNSKGSFGSAGTLGTAPLNSLARLVINANAGGTQYIRLSYEAGGSTWIDGAEYTQSCTDVFDYGDAPASYGVAAHKLLVKSLYLGASSPDSEAGSAHSIRANGDGADEDGPPPQAAGSLIPSFAVLQMTDMSYSTVIRTTNQTGTTARLAGWIDFDKSGTFETDEMASVDVPTGSNNTNTTLTWANIPTDIKLGTTYVRLRFTTDTSVAVQPTGTMANGEVEDFILPIQMDIPPNSPSISVKTGDIPLACQTVIFEDNFNDLTPSETNFWAANRASPVAIRSWTAAGGGADTYARFIDWGLGYGTSIYFGNGDVRNINPSLGSGFSFDAQGKLLTVIDSLALRDSIDDLEASGTTRDSHWGVLPVSLSRSFPTTVGKTYRLYFSALRETGDYLPGIMRVDAPGGSVHFKAPGGNEGILNYAIDFTATSTNSSISFINYGHFGPNSSGYCNVVNNGWCTVGGLDNNGKSANELSIDNVKLVEAACSTGAIGGYVYQDANLNNTYDMGSETTLPAITIKLYSEMGTPTDVSDDRLVKTASTGADGSYLFSYLDTSSTYRVEVEIADPDLPNGVSLGTPSPLSNLAVPLNSIKTANFGFDAPGSSVKDYGDAPASYGHASHTIVSGLKLGETAPDAESSSQFSFNALGDGADEDGAPRAVLLNGLDKSARFPVLKLTDTNYTLPYTVSNSTNAVGNLYAWIDFDKNGSFDADEASSVAVPTNLVNGSLNLTWNSIPADIKLGTTFIRVRLSTDPILSANTPTGSVNSGEVEDYPIAIYQPIPPDSPSLQVVTSTPLACQQVIFQDNFNDIANNFRWGPNALDNQALRDWVRSGGGPKTYAELRIFVPEQQRSVYFGNGAVRGVEPDLRDGLSFDSNGHLTSPIHAIALRDAPDDLDPGNWMSHWGPEILKLSRSFATEPGKAYRLYFKAIPEPGNYVSGVMRVDAPGGSIHFKAPASAESVQNYAIEFTATASTSTIAFVNYGHISSGWCDPQVTAWCTTGGVLNETAPNELAIDDVVLTEAACSTGSISGRVYADANKNDTYDATESGLNTIKVSLYDQNGTANDFTDDRLVYSTASDSTGLYTFNAVDTSRTYRLEVDTADTHLPNGLVIGTTNPLVNVAVVANATTANQNFGFDSTNTPPVLGVVGEYRFDDCGSGTWNVDSSGKNNTAIGTAQVLTEDYKNYACTAIANPNWNVEVPHIPDYALPNGAVSILVYDHKNVWNPSRLIEKGWTEKFNIDLKQVSDDRHGTVSVTLNGKVIDTGETYYTTLNNGAVNDTQWMHVLVSFGSQGMKLYINGILKGTNSYTGGLQNVQGNFKLPGLEGYFDEFYIFNQQPSDTQVQQLYSNLIANKNWDGSERACACSGVLGDYGDAPASYGTPVHTVVAGLYLGTGVPDTEANSQPNAFANGDDNNSNDDEDGVTLYPMWQGVDSQVSVQTTGSGYLQAWIDWNADGDFADSGEQVATNLTDGDTKDLNIAAGTIDFIVTPPANAVATRTYARFRWSSTQTLGFSGSAVDGEVEDYEASVSMLPGQACDASVWYGSTEASNLPSHLRKLNFANGSYTLSAPLIPPGTPTNPLRYSNLAYRAQDGYLYGTVPAGANTGTTIGALVRIGSNGARAALPWPVPLAGLPIPPNTKNYAAAAFSNSGYFYMSSPDAKFYKIDVTTNPPTVVDFIDTVGLPPTTLGGVAPTGPQDFVISMDEKWLYGIYGRNANDPNPGAQLIRVALDASSGYAKGTIQLISAPLARPASIPTTQTGTLGAVYGDLTGNLYGARNGDGHLFRIDIAGMDTATPTATYTDLSIPTGVVPYNNNDGASCASELFPLALPSDYSDAPASYGFAKHIILSGMSMGSGAPDAEAAALTQANAEGDDLDGSDDENGVTLPSFIRGQTATVTVNVSDLTGGSSYLQAWIDWNADGDFLDANEQVATNLQDNVGLDTNASSGAISFVVTPPATASTNPSYARFRWSSSYALAATGAAKDGEVEDYKLTVSTLPSTLGGIGEYRFDDCGNGEAKLDSSSKQNTALGTPTVIVNNNKTYACSAAQNNSWDMEVPHIADYALTSGAVSIWFYDYNSIWGDARLLEKGWDNTNKLRLSLKPSTEYRKGTVSAELNGYKIDTGETYYTTQAVGATNDSQWVNTVLSFGPQGMKLYINGVLKGTNAYTGGIQNVLGNFRLPGFEGYFDEFYIINQQPTDLQVLDLYNTIANNKNWDGSPRLCNCAVVSGDYGDAPLSYGAPVHSIVAGMYLGNTAPDAETTAPANSAANGDDTSGADDEDGVSIPQLGQGATAQLSIPVAGIGGYLQAWVDWNADGDFADSGEQVATNLQDNGSGDSISSAGSIGFTLNVPATAVVGSTYARFRWSSTPNLDASAAASDGEVEDYSINISAPETKVAGVVWFDANNDGVQNDGANAGIEGTQLELYNPSTTSVIATTLTDVNGVYQFTTSAGLNPATAYQIRIANFESTAPQTDWAITSLHTGADTTVDSDASLASPYWTINLTSPNAGSTTSHYDFGFVLSTPAGCLSQGLTGIANSNFTNAHPNAYDFVFNNKLVSGYCAEKADADPADGDSYQVNNLDRQGLTATQRSKLARLYSALQDPEIIFALAPVTAAGKQQRRLDDLMTYMTWYYTYFAEDLASVTSAHIDSNANLTSEQRTVMKALMQKIIDRVAGTHGQAQYPEQAIFWLWNMTSSNRQDIITPARFVDGLSCTSTGTITGKVYKDLNGNNSFDSTTESGIAAMSVALYDQNGTPAITSDDGLVTTVTTDTNGAYGLINIDASKVYRIQVDTSDPDLPAGYTVGTTNPLTNVTVAANAVETDKNFGFDPPLVSLSGRVFEDINYGGGNGRDQTLAAGVGINGAKVELYNSTGNLVATTLTATTGSTSGVYQFNSISAGDYYVRVVSDSVNSTRAGSTGAELGVLTYRTDSSSAVTNEVGGHMPALSDGAANTGTQVLDLSAYKLTGGTVVQNLQKVTATSTVTGVNFGFNFDTIVNTNDSGQGSLRQFILNANLLGGEATLAQVGLTAGLEHSIFMIPGAGPHTITPSSALPSLTGSATALNAATQAGASCAVSGRSLKIALDGSNAGVNVSGLTVDAANIVVRGLAIGKFTEAGIQGTANADNLSIVCNHLGLVADGISLASNGTNGLLVKAGASDLKVGGNSDDERNVVSGNTRDGIRLEGVATATIARNYIGTDITGTVALSNNREKASYSGIYAGKPTTATTNSSAITIRNNLISGNDLIAGVAPLYNVSSGIWLEGVATATITGNLIGTNASGTAALRNTGYGIYTKMATDIMIGGTTAAERNVIAANFKDAINTRFGTNRITILGNYLGTDITGTLGLGNTDNGIFLADTQNAVIGNSTAAGRNIIASNLLSGIRNSNSPGTVIAGNYVGLDVSGSVARGNQLHGIYVQNSANVRIGGGNLADRNLVAASKVIGVFIDGTTSNTLIENNFVGLKADGMGDAGNLNAGIETKATTGVVIRSNVVAANKTRGIHLVTSPSTTITNNLIGLNADGTLDRGNSSHGIDIENGVSGLSISNNTISGNGGHGVFIITMSTNNKTFTSSSLTGNRIGLALDGSTALANDGAGVWIEASNGLVIGGYAASEANKIAYNKGDGVAIVGASSNKNTLRRNSIYANTGLGIDLNNDDVTTNDANDADAGYANDSLNFPVLVSARLDGANLLLKGCAPEGATLELYEADITVGTATAGANKFGRSKDYGEGQVFLTSLIEGAVGDSDTNACTLPTDVDGNVQTGMKAFSFSLPMPAGVVSGDLLTATASVQNVGTSEFSPIVSYSNANGEIKGSIFEDLNYGGGAGRPFTTQGVVGINGAVIELYNASGVKLASTSSAVVNANEGGYSFTELADGNYFVRVVNNTVHSSRAGSNGTELGVQTYRTDGSTAVLNEVGGRVPSLVDAPANTSNQALNPSNFSFADRSIAQTIQPITIVGGEVIGVSFGFNFSTVVNTNDAGQGSLRQFLFNNKLLSTEALAQTLPTNLAADYPVGTETSIFMIPTTQLASGKAVIQLSSGALNLERANTAIDGRTQLANMGSGTIVLNNSSSNGVNLMPNATGSVLRDLTVSAAAGSGIVLDDVDNATIERVTSTNNSQYGISVMNEALSNRVLTSVIAHNTWAGIAHLGNGIGNTYSQNSIHDNGGLGIDLGVDGVSANDALDSDTGANKLLNYPEVAAGSSISSNGSKVVAYDFDLDVPSNTHGYRVEFFRNTTADVSKHGEGEIYLGYVDINHAGGGQLNFKGSLNANQSVPADANIAVTLTEKNSPTTLSSTSEFSGVRNGKVSVCTDLINGTGAEMTVNENAAVITYLESTDDNGNPITYVISGGADGHQFIVQDPEPGASLDCQVIVFREPNIIGARSASVTKAAPMLAPGDYEAPSDSGGDNIYDVDITATVNGKDYVRPVTVGVQNINEPPSIISESQTEFLEGNTGVVLNLEAYDQDAGDEEGKGIRYALSGGADRARFNLNAQTGELSFITVPDFEVPLDAGNDNVYDLDVRVMDAQGLSSVASLKIAVADDKLNDGVSLQTKVLLQGSYLATTGLMQDSLRTLGLLPMSQPYTAQPFNYTGTEQLNLDLATVTGKDALVDWVLVELRDVTNPNTILASKAAIVQRDGDVIDATTGSSLLNFKVAAGNYLVSLRHRNHLGVRTATAVALGSTPALIDFSQTTTKVAGTAARLEVDPLALLWSGDVNHDERLIVSGIGSDSGEIFNAILKAPANTSLNSSYRLNGYLDSDLNMDGNALFMGPNNDTNVLLGNVLLFPTNINKNSNYIVVGGLAK